MGSLDYVLDYFGWGEKEVKNPLSFWLIPERNGFYLRIVANHGMELKTPWIEDTGEFRSELISLAKTLIKERRYDLLNLSDLLTKKEIEEAFK